MKKLDLFKELSIHLTEIRSRKETDWKLYQEHEELNKNLCSKQRLPESRSEED